LENKGWQAHLLGRVIPNVAWHNNHKMSINIFLMLGVGKLLNEHGFSAESSHELVRKAIGAIKSVRKELNVSGLEWLDDMEKDLSSSGNSA
jgi:hypothetical protein